MYLNMSGLQGNIGRKRGGRMNYTFFALIVLCITALSIVAMLLAFCYKQEKSVAMISKARASENGISTELELNIDKKEKNKKENNK